MTAQRNYDKTNTGTFSKNMKKRSGKQDPDITGSINVEGRWFWFNAWQKQDKEGAIFYSASIKPKEDKRSSDDGATARRAPDNDNYRFSNDNAQDDRPPF